MRVGITEEAGWGLPNNNLPSEKKHTDISYGESMFSLWTLDLVITKPYPALRTHLILYMYPIICTPGLV